MKKIGIIRSSESTSHTMPKKILKASLSIRVFGQGLADALATCLVNLNSRTTRNVKGSMCEQMINIVLATEVYTMINASVATLAIQRGRGSHEINAPALMLVDAAKPGGKHIIGISGMDHKVNLLHEFSESAAVVILRSLRAARDGAGGDAADNTVGVNGKENSATRRHSKEELPQAGPELILLLHWRHVGGRMGHHVREAAPRAINLHLQKPGRDGRRLHFGVLDDRLQDP